MTQADIYVNGAEKLRLKTSYPNLTKIEIRAHLGLGTHVQFDWDEKEWRVAFGQLDKLIDLVCTRYDRVLVHTRHVKNQRCNTSCQKAKNNKCVCSCQGVNHKKGQPTSFYRLNPNQVIDLGDQVEEVTRVVKG